MADKVIQMYDTDKSNRISFIEFRERNSIDKATTLVRQCISSSKNIDLTQAQIE